MPKPVKNLKLEPCSSEVKREIEKYLLKLRADNQKSLVVTLKMKRAQGGSFYDAQVKYHQHVRGFIGNALAQNKKRRVKHVKRAS